MHSLGINGFLATVTPPLASENQTRWVTAILQELGRSQASGFLLDLGLWTLLGHGAARGFQLEQVGISSCCFQTSRSGIVGP